MADNVTLTAVYNILFTNDVVCGLVVDFISQLKKSPYYRFNVKQQAKRIENEMQKYEKRIAEISGKRIFFMADANEVIAEELQPDLLKMEYSIKSEFDKHKLNDSAKSEFDKHKLNDSAKSEFDKHKLNDSALLAKMELTRCMCELSCLSLDKRIEEVTPYNQDVKRLTYLRLTALFSYVDGLSNILYQSKEYINLNESSNCKMAMQIIQRKLTDCNIISRAISTSDKLNPAQN